MKLKAAALALCLLLLAGCGKQGTQFSAAVITTGGGDAEKPPAEDTAAPETEEPAAPESAAETENLFETMPRTYLFCSGAGGWSTELYLEPDGSFSGEYHDSDMGVADTAAFPNGTMYICNFTGKFTQPEKVDEYTYAMRLESLELEHPDDETEEITGGVRYIYSGPCGLEGAEELRVYLPGTPVEGLPEEVLWAARGPYNWEPTEAGTLGLYIIYNVTSEHGFVGYPLTEE